MSDAADRILAVIRAIPRGQVLAYGEVARRSGLPGRARLVARTLALNDDAKLPWHRVVRADGRVAFPPDDPRFHRQCALLAADGVAIAAGRVRMANAPSIDRQIWGPPHG